MSKVSINIDRLKALQSRERLSQKKLAAKVGVDVGTVSRWVRGEVTNLRQSTFGKLAKALRVEEDILRGEGPLPNKQPAPPEGSPDKMNIGIHPRCRNALGLVASRYRVTRQQIVEVAPLLFYIAAEQSLERRRVKLRNYLEAADTVMDAKPSHLASKLAVNLDSTNQEEKSIAARDLFAQKVKEVDDDWDESSQNPFAEYLTESLKGVLETAEPISWSSDWAPHYEICEDVASRMVAGDQQATRAIQSGLVALHELGRALPKATPEERVEWIRNRTAAFFDLDLDGDSLLLHLKESVQELKDQQRNTEQSPTTPRAKP